MLDVTGSAAARAGPALQAKRKFKATTNSNHSFPAEPVGADLTPARPNEAWVSDITYVPTDEGWLYLAGIKDVFTCEMVGYEMGARMTQD
jgi:transposase InsO family protein